MEENSHDQVSELLGPFERGELGDADASLVRAHLEVCEDCRAERTALRALLAADVEPLSEIDRARLRAAVAEGVGLRTSSERADVFSRPRRSLAARFAPALATAAVIALAVVAVPKLFGALDLGAGDSAGSAGGASQEGFAGPLPVFDDPQRDAELYDATAGAAADTTSADQVERSEVGGRTAAPKDALSARSSAQRRSKFSAEARGHPVFGRFATAYDPADADALAATFLEDLAGRAPDAATATQIRECGLSVFDQSPTPVLPAYAAVGPRGRKDAVVLGFVWPSSATSKVLDNYMLWMWRLGEGCEIPIAYEAGPIR